MSKAKKPKRGASSGGPSRAQASSQQEDRAEEMESTQTQTLTQRDSLAIAKKNFDQMDPKLQEKKVCEVVRYLLCAQGRAVPVKRKELLDKVITSQYSRALLAILDLANDRLQEIFGLEVKKIKRGTVESIILVNKLPASLTGGLLKWSKADKSRVGLLSVVLALIMMKQGRISEEHLWSCLGRLKLSRDGMQHSTLGDVERIISKEFVDELYLDKEKQVVGDGHAYSYRWGPRANEEVDRVCLLQFVAETYGADVATWKKHFQQTD